MASARTVILASGSAARRTMLQSAGIVFDVVPADIDEESVRQELQRKDPPASTVDVAATLAMAKAREVSARHPQALVIGSDQVLDIRGEILSKPGDEAGVRATLQKLSGKTHALHSAVAIAIAGKIVWTETGLARLTMRHLSPRFIDDYISRAGEEIRGSVGAYQIEGLGVQLFERVEGDHFTILGMPLLPLLGQLRSEGVLAA